MVVGAVLAALLVGFLAGFFGFKVKSRWCPDCGAGTRESFEDASLGSHDKSLAGQA